MLFFFWVFFAVGSYVLFRLFWGLTCHLPSWAVSFWRSIIPSKNCNFQYRHFSKCCLASFQINHQFYCGGNYRCWQSWNLTNQHTVISENRSSYDSLLFGIASVAGVFLGFYFTSLNTVAGSLYAKCRSAFGNCSFRNVSITFPQILLFFSQVLSTLLLGVGVLFDYRPKFAVVVILCLRFLRHP